MAKISVVVPVYNVADYLKNCIDSIINQTFEDIEIILVDDGSTDSSGLICDEYKNKDKRIIVIHKENGGLSDARNVGINKAQGEFITFIDSDDSIREDMLENLYYGCLEGDSDMSICGYQKVDEYGNEIEEPLKENKGVYTSEQFFKKFPLEYSQACSKLYKTKLFNEIKFPFGKIHEDEFVFHKLVNECKKITMLDEKMYYYLQRQGSITNVNYNVGRLDVIEAYTDRMKLFDKLGYSVGTELLIKNCISFFNNAANNLDMTIQENKERFRELQQLFKDEVLKIKCNITIKTKIKLMVFFISPKLFNYLSKCKGGKI